MKKLITFVSCLIITLALVFSLPGSAMASGSSLQLAPAINQPDGLSAGQTTDSVFYDQTYTYQYSGGSICLSSQDGQCTAPATDDEAIVYVNGQKVVDDLSYTNAFGPIDFAPFLQVGSNQIHVQLVDRVGPSEGGSALWLVPSGGGGGPCEGGANEVPFGISGTLYHTHLDGPIVYNDFVTQQLYYDADITGDHCPEASIKFNPSADPSFTLNSTYGEVTIAQSGQLDSVPNPSNDRRLPLFGTGVELTPPSVTIYELWRRSSNWTDFGLTSDQKIGDKFTPQYPAYKLAYIVSLSVTFEQIVETDGEGVVQYIYQAFQQLVNLAPAFEAPPQNPISSGQVVTNTSPQATSKPNADVINDLNSLFGPEFVGRSKISLLHDGSSIKRDEQNIYPSMTVDNPLCNGGSIKGPGQNIHYSGTGFTPNSRVYVVLTRIGDAKPTIETEARANVRGTISGTLRLPQNAQPGRWLTAAVDTQLLYTQLKEIGNGQSTSLTPYIAANTWVVPNYTEVKIDIKPGSKVNPINLRSNGVIPVAVLTTPSFNARTVAPRTMQFGPDAATIWHDRDRNEDDSFDGRSNMLMLFATQQTGILPSDTSACLFGQTTTGTYIFGCDIVTIVPHGR